MKHFLLLYEFGSDYCDKRAALRPAHLEHANAAAARGELQLAGPTVADDGPLGGVLLFKSETRATAEAFAKADPYVTGGLARAWRVREWTTLVGADALSQP